MNRDNQCPEITPHTHTLVFSALNEGKENMGDMKVAGKDKRKARMYRVKQKERKRRKEGRKCVRKDSRYMRRREGNKFGW